MFTGLVEEAGRVLAFEEAAGSETFHLEIEGPKVAEDLAIGDSLAVNGCCLTVVEKDGARLRFDLLAETVRLTGFRALKPGAKVNLERSLLPNTRMGGHFVSGHVDTTGEVAQIERKGGDVFIRVEPEAALLRYVVSKGSIALDGISLTVAEVDATGFAVWLIPHTMEVTNLHERQVGDTVNLEFDMLAKYVEKLLKPNAQ
ncbi:MAG: riboflavin synthase [Verrucomicrobiota bacterium]